MKEYRVYWLQGWEGRVMQGGLYRSDIAAVIKLQEQHINGHVVGIKISEKDFDKGSYTIQFIINTEDQIATNYENKEDMNKQYDDKHRTTAFVEGKLFQEDMSSGPDLQFKDEDDE